VNSDAGQPPASAASPGRSPASAAQALDAGSPAPRRGSRKANRVLLLAEDVSRIQRAYVDGHLNSAAEVHLVGNRDQFIAALSRYSLISELTILTHGGPNAILFTAPGGGFQVVTLAQLAAFYRQRPDTPRPAVTRLHLQSCNVGLKPVEMLAFARVLGAVTVQGWNHFYVPSKITLDIPEGVTVDKIVARLREVRSYVPELVTAEALAARRGKVDVLVEWFRVEDDAAPLPQFDPATGSLQGRRNNFKPVRSAQPRIVETGKELDVLTAELAQWGFADPSKPLLRIELTTAGLTEG
jgi:hypothetical protein